MSEELEYCYFCEGYMCDCEQGEGEVEAEVKLSDFVTVDYSRSKELSTCYELFRIRRESGDIAIGLEDGELKSIWFEGVGWHLDSCNEWELVTDDE